MEVTSGADPITASKLSASRHGLTGLSFGVLLVGAPEEDGSALPGGVFFASYLLLQPSKSLHKLFNAQNQQTSIKFYKLLQTSINLETGGKKTTEIKYAAIKKTW